MKRICLLLISCASAAVGLLAQESVTPLSTDTTNTHLATPLPTDTTNTYLDSIYHELPEVMISGERPMVKATEGKLVYDLPRLIENRPVDNAYDAIKELPGVAEVSDKITLGGQGVVVVIDGKVTNMSTEQLYALLKTIPSSRVEKAEVMYSAPARYQVRGAMINICLKQGSESNPSLQGELYSAYSQNHYEGLTERASLLYSGTKFSADFLYSYDHGHSYFLTDKEALHTLKEGTVHQIKTDEVQKGRDNTHSIRLGGDYRIAKDHQLSFVYYTNISKGRNWGTVNGSQLSHTDTRETSQLHNGRLDYRTPFGMKAGVEYTNYTTPSTQLLQSKLYEKELNFLSKDRQQINSWKGFVAQEHQLNHGWGINYGLTYTHSVDNSSQYYYHPDTGELLPESNHLSSRNREQTVNVYAGFNKSIGDKVSLDASLAAEQFHNNTWNAWNVFPTLNLSYTPSAGNVWQFSFSSDKEYPEYWAVQNAIYNLGGEYSEIHGNPYLKPSIDYHAQLMYILNSKYMFAAWVGYVKDKSFQTLYQSPDRLVEIYKIFNCDFEQQAGIQATIPFKVKQWLDSRITLMGVYDRQKDSDFWDIPFDRNVVYGMAFMNNTFTLSTKPDIKFMLSGMIRSKAIQGAFDLPASGHLNVALRYTFAKGKAVLTLKCNDLFETDQVSTQMYFKGQNVRNHYASFREFGISFTYKFGGYKEKERQAVDTSRFK